MTQTQTSPAVEAPDVAAAVAAIRSRGLRLSTSRRLMLEAFYATDDPLTAEALAVRLGAAEGIDLASIYRNLETLEEVGLVRHFHLGHGAGLYARTNGGVREYLVCESCKTVRQVDPAELDAVREEVRTRFGYRASFTHFPIVGLCPRCRTRHGAK
jgi:Fur family transcriptional regulator, ferric uptake regulator